MIEVLLVNDQLNQQRVQGNVFSGFVEGAIHFLPTYKFFHHTDTYDSHDPSDLSESNVDSTPTSFEPNASLSASLNRSVSGTSTASVGATSVNTKKPKKKKKGRVPGYTDRVLWKPSSNVALVAYESVPEIRTSDHKPVCAAFRVKFKHAETHHILAKHVEVAAKHHQQCTIM